MTHPMLGSRDLVCEDISHKATFHPVVNEPSAQYLMLPTITITKTIHNQIIQVALAATHNN